MSTITSTKAIAEMQAIIAKAKSTAKTAKVPAKKQAAFSKSNAKAEAANAKWERPNLNALCRKLAGGDMAAGLLLFQVLYLWRNRKHKLERNGREWLAHPREKWASASGLSHAELAKRALPRLKKYCFEFLTIKAQGHGADKKLWISVDWIGLKEAMSGSGGMPWDMFEAVINHIGPGNEKLPADAYQKGPK
jgi:hypothetical protein